MSSIEQALAAVESTCPPSSEADQYESTRKQAHNQWLSQKDHDQNLMIFEKENRTPAARCHHTASANPMKSSPLDDLVGKINRVISPEHSKSVTPLMRRMLFPPPTQNRNVANAAVQEEECEGMSMATLDYLRRHDLLPARGPQAVDRRFHRILD